MASQAVDLAFGPDIPETDCCVTATRGEDVEGWVLGKAVDTGKVAMVTADDLVLLEVPA